VEVGEYKPAPFGSPFLRLGGGLVILRAMPKAKAVPVTAKKTSAGRTKKASAAKAAAPKTPRKPRAPGRSKAVARKKAEPPAPAAVEPVVQRQGFDPPIEDAQSQVVASKFASVETAPAKVRPTLLPSYDESRLLLLVRDPQTLFASWDIAPSTIEAMKARLGRRGFAVSTLTLRLTRAGGSASVMHVSKRARSRYLKIDGGPSFMAEIGFTTPAGRFELVARSAPCFVPMGPVARAEAAEAGRRAVLGYREAIAVARRGGLFPNPGSGPGSGPNSGAARSRGNSSAAGASSPTADRAKRVLGGASDLYRR
jgi:Domain of unknown function (DUF4912)